MKQINQKSMIVLGLALVAVLAAGMGASQGGSDVLAKLGLTPASAQEGMLDALASGNAYSAAAIKAFKALSPSARAEIVRAGLAWVKARVESADFKMAYAKMREDEKPASPEVRQSADDQLKQQKADMEKSIAETEKAMANMDAETRKSLTEAIKQMRKQMDEMEKNPEMMGMMRQGVEMQKAEDQKQFQERTKAWEENFPADPKGLIAKRIREFLKMSEDIDFAAKLVPSGDRMKFADERYEGKPSEWKMLFRAGKEATEAARAFATSWLAEIER